MRRLSEREDLVGYLLPKTVVGLALWLLIFALGVCLSGVVFFVAYERRLSDVQNQLNSVRSQLTQQLNDAVTQLQNADKAIQGGGVTGTASLGPVGSSARLLAQIGPSVVVVEGMGSTGARTSGSGFVLNSTPSQSWILTSYQLIAGSVAAAQAYSTSQASPTPPPANPFAAITSTATATASPAAVPPPPQATVNIGGTDHTGTVYTWDAADNLALIIVTVGNVATLQFSNEVPVPGLDVWAVSASGGQYGATAAAGQVVTNAGHDVSTSAAFGPQATGGPLVDQEGRVVGVLYVSPAPAPTPPAPTPAGAPPNGPPTGLAVPVHLACVQVIICPH
ncbi:MAG TPA: serine protease [Actinomycetota bacterium]|nr:serine protease [Actinomycetota bacterium]